MEICVRIAALLERAGLHSAAALALDHLLSTYGHLLSTLHRVAVELEKATLLWLQGDANRSLSVCHEARTRLFEAFPLDESALAVGCLRLLGVVYREVGRFEESAASLQHAIWMQESKFYTRLVEQAAIQHGQVSEQCARAVLCLAQIRQVRVAGRWGFGLIKSHRTFNRSSQALMHFSNPFTFIIYDRFLATPLTGS